jgi:hypothetical protein
MQCVRCGPADYKASIACSTKRLLPCYCRLLSFIQWVEAEHPEVNLTQHGCFNPYVGAVEAPLSALSQPEQIGGCVPQVPVEDNSSVDVACNKRQH